MNEIAIVMYHYVRDLRASRYPGIKGLETSQFRKQLEFLSNYGTFVSCDDIQNAFAGGKLPERPILLTFDDGYIDHYTVAFPLLHELGIPAIFSMPGKMIAEGKMLDTNKIHFILASESVESLLQRVFERLNYYRGQTFPIPENRELYESIDKTARFDRPEVIFIKRLLQVELEKTLRTLIVDDLFRACVAVPEETFCKELYMDIHQVSLMKRLGMTWGVHGYDHYWMNRLSRAELKQDIAGALNVFDGVIDPKNWVCCYPYGSWSDAVIEYIKTQGCTMGLGTEIQFAQTTEEWRYHLPRLDTNDLPPQSEQYLSYL